MTTSSVAPKRFQPGTSRGPRRVRTLAVQMAMEMERQLEVAARIKELRGVVPQPKMADQVGVTLRAYQRWEAGDGIRWDNLERLAELHGVSTNWLLYGDERPEGSRSQLDRMEAMLEEVLALLQDAAPPGPEGELGRRVAKRPPSGGDHQRKPPPAAEGGSRDKSR
jgi:hypothetical protein